MRMVLFAASLSVVAVSISAGVAAAVPPAPGRGANPAPPWGVPVTVHCPPVPTPENPDAVPAGRDPRCGVDHWAALPGLAVTSNAYERRSVLRYNWGGWVTVFGSRQWQLHDRTGRLWAGTPQVPEHLPFGTEVPPPPPDQGLSARGRTIVDRLSRVSVELQPGVRYTSDTSDKSVLLTTPQGSLVVQAPYNPVTHRREFRPVNNFQALNAQSQYLMGDTLTFAVPEQDWPNAAVPCADLLRQLPPHGSHAAAESVAATPGARDTTAAAAKPPAVGCLPAPGLSPTADTQQQPRDQGQSPSSPPSAADRDKDINSAISAVATQFGMALSIGGLIGGVAGLGIGCLVGVAVGTGALSGNLPIGLVTGCIPGAGIGAAIGTIIGSAVLGVPVLIASATGAYTLLHDEGYVARPLRPTLIAARLHPAPRPRATGRCRK
jgi:hypothetical protein